MKLSDLYEYREGKLFFKTSRGGQRAGVRAGTLNPVNGYRYVYVQGKLHAEHRVVWGQPRACAGYLVGTETQTPNPGVYMITWRECVCKCGECGLNVTSKFFDLINDFRDAFGKPMIILSGARCEQRNKEVGGAKHSAHVEGLAVDVERTPSLLAFCTEANLERFGLYMEDPAATPTWLHLQARPTKSGKRIFKP